MGSVYWGAQFIPSGWIAIVYGLSPVVTAALSKVLFKQKGFTVGQFFGLACCFIGLMVIFANDRDMQPTTLWGLLAVVFSTIAHALSAIIIKQLKPAQSAVQSTQGGLMVTVILFTLTLILSGEEIRGDLPKISWFSIIYLGVVATAVGFSLYYYVLQQMQATKVSMITLITPVTALLLGAFVNDEPLTISVLLDAFIVLMGLALFELNINIGRLFRRFLYGAYSSCQDKK